MCGRVLCRFPPVDTAMCLFSFKFTTVCWCVCWFYQCNVFQSEDLTPQHALVSKSTIEHPAVTSHMDTLFNIRQD